MKNVILAASENELGNENSSHGSEVCVEPWVAVRGIDGDYARKSLLSVARSNKVVTSYGSLKVLDHIIACLRVWLRARSPKGNNSVKPLGLVYTVLVYVHKGESYANICDAVDAQTPSDQAVCRPLLLPFELPLVQGVAARA